MSIALLGGRFDPPHNGHLAIAKEILKQQLADKVWLIPANTHPWRPMIAPSQDRLAMTKLLAQGVESVRVSDIEILRGGETYTIDTIREISNNTNNEFPISNVKFQMSNEKTIGNWNLEIRNLKFNYIWILGSDQIQNFPRWKEYRELQKLIRFLVFLRKGYENIVLPEHFTMIKGNGIPNISSSMIRQRIKKRLSISNLVPEKVEEYIIRKKLYR